MDSLPVNVVDISVGVVLLISALLAYGRGFVHEVLSVGGWVGAIFATIYGYPYLKPYAHDLISIEVAADLAASVTVFVATLLVLSLLTRAIAKGVQSSALNVLDRSLGFLFGVLRGAVLVCLAYIAVEWMLPPADQPQWLRSARSMPLIEEGASFLKSLVPEDAATVSAEAAGEAGETARQLMETQRVLNRMLNVKPKGGEPGAADGYARGARQGLDRLIESNQ